MQSKVKSDPLWFKDAVIYELSVRSFCDGNGDGIGDFQGLTSKLDYLEDLGVNTIWLLPFFPSPLHDDGFDVIEYCDVHPDYGTLSDFRHFMKEAHQRGMRVITELVLNHTSDQHPWFQKSRKARAGSRYRDFYVWNNSTEKFKEARVLLSINNDNWAWDTGAKAYYWHRFSRHQPELNYDNPEVQLEIIKVIDFWLKLGVDGFRLPSVAFLFEEEGTICENLPQTHEFLKKIRAHIDKFYSDRVLMAEVNQWPEDSAAYFGEGRECNLCLNFSLMPRLFLGLRTEDSYPIVDILEQTPKAPDNSQWALFLRNHDEVGLEMVTEEEKDYLFKAYANDPHMKHNVGIRRRLAPMLNNDRRKIELLYSLLFSLPGTPIIYYGDEIGMGDNIYLGDRHGVRTPMQWNMNLNAGFSTANPQRLVLPIVTDPVYRYEAVNVAMQEETPSSLMTWVKTTIAMRKRLRVFGQGDLSFIESSNSKVFSFARSFKNQRVVIIANLSQFSQMTTLDFSEFSGSSVVEAFSQNRFSRVAGRSYPVTLGPYGYYWLQIDASEKKETTLASGELPQYQSELSWERTFSHQENIRVFERKILPLFLKKSSWFANKTLQIDKIAVDKIIPIKAPDGLHYFFIVEVHYVQKLPELYFLPLSFVQHDTIFENGDYNSQSILCRANFQEKPGFVIDSTYDKGLRDFIFNSIDRRTKIREDAGVIEFSSGIYAKLDTRKVDSKVLSKETGNPLISYNDQFVFKFYRKVERDINPDLEMVRFLSENTGFKNSPKYAGSVDYTDNDGKAITLGILEEKVESQSDSWLMTTDSVGRFYERVMASAKKEKLPKLINKSTLSFEEAPELVQELMGRGFYERVVRLAQRTAEMHLALASENSDPVFAPEIFTANYQRSVYSSLRKLTRDTLKNLKQSMDRLAIPVQTLAKEVLSKEQEILECFNDIQLQSNAVKTRIHGDLHLGRILFTGKDFVISDFDGEHELSFGERRLKKSPLKDVAAVMRSFHYAAFGKILLNENYREKDIEFLDQWAELWQHYVIRFYLAAYLERSGLGKDLSERDDSLMYVFLLEKAVEELGHELSHRIPWATIPLKGILYHLSRWSQSKK